MTLLRLQRWRRANVAIVIAAVPCLGALTWWSWNVPPRTVVGPTPAPPPAQRASPALTITPLPLAAFSDLAPPRVAAPPTAAPAETPSPAQAAPRGVELLGIVREGGGFKAALYVQALDRVVVVGADEKAGRFTVQRVSANQVELLDERGVRTLALVKAGGL